jgi:phospholipid/cholesterol/gamma-HCH transport system substrate-binding protein
MINARVIEIAVGIFVALGLAALVMLALKVSNISALSDQEGYDVIARFENVGGLKVKSPVNMAGVRIGRVVAIDFDPKRFQAVVRMRIAAQYNTIPEDTSAGIYTSGVLGENYVGLEAGAEDKVLAAGSEITMTQSAMVLETLVSKFLFDKAAENKSSGGGQ